MKQLRSLFIEPPEALDAEQFRGLSLMELTVGKLASVEDLYRTAVELPGSHRSGEGPLLCHAMPQHKKPSASGSPPSRTSAPCAAWSCMPWRCPTPR